jgi:3'-phosphoadenosine 5'-phosphosulfate sulfotransferase (PAPS reductase)/FAD synthetase
LKIAVWFSSGAASAVAAKLTIEKYGADHEVVVVNNPVAEEHPDNERFLKDVERWLGQEIEIAINPDYFTCSARDVWERKQYMAGVSGAPCTTELKKKARQYWERENNPDMHVLGFTIDEQKRYDRFIMSERENVLPVLIDAGYTKQDCLDLLLKENIDPPITYALGMPNSNCLACVKASSPTYWNLMRKIAPEAFSDRAEQSRRLGARLVRVKGKRIFLDELDPEAKGAPLKTMQIECGIFCEED